MKAGWITAGVAAAVLIPGLAACGGSTSGSGSSPSAHPSEAASAPSGTLTPPGTKLAVGQTATVGWVPGFGGDAAEQGAKLQVTVLSIEKGSIDDVNRVHKLSAGERLDTAYYVRLRFKALENIPPKVAGTNNPIDVMAAAQDKGLDPELVLLRPGLFKACDAKTPPSPFASGSSYDACLTYLMPEGTTFQSIEWHTGPHKAGQDSPYVTHPVVWSGS
jgi:hypothetical protein